MGWTMLAQMVLNGAMLGSTYVLVALGLTLVYGIMHIVNFAHGTFYMLGAFTIYYLLTGLRIPYLLALLLSMLALGLFGAAIERVFFRRFLGQFLTVLVLSIGLALVIESVGWLGFGIQERAVGITFPGILRFGGVVFPIQRLVIVLVSLGLVAALYLFVYRTRPGTAMRAVEQDSEAASLQGVNVGRTCTLAFVIGSALAGAAGGLMSPLLFLTADMGSWPLLIAFTLIIIGGLGNVTGCVVAGYLVGFAQSFSETLLGPEIAQVIIFCIFVAVLLVRPTGIFGRAPR